jgi:hypothetical protein
VYTENKDGEKKSWLWRKITIHDPLHIIVQWYVAYACQIRCYHA